VAATRRAMQPPAKAGLESGAKTCIAS